MALSRLTSSQAAFPPHRSAFRCAWWTVGALLCGCVRYHPMPVDPPQLAAAYAARQLDDSALRRFLTAAGATAPDTTWRPRELALVALYFHPDLDVARATWREAVAGEITAGARPQPSAGVAVDRAARPDEGKATPWSVALTAELTLEVGGKRGARLARARALALASELRLRALAWQVAEEAAAATTTAAGADQALANATMERETLDAVLTLLRARYAQGAATLTDVARAEGDVQAAIVAVVGARRERLAARAALARALALPVPRADALPLAPDTVSSCAVLDSVPVPALGRDALQRRADLGAELATYAAAEAEVRLAVAQQYPDLALGPGIGWEQGIGRWTLGLLLPRVVLNRNRGPIAEAEARRAAAAARFDGVQQRVLGDVAAAAEECGGAHRELTDADSLLTGAQRRLALARAAYERGETGATDVAFARLALIRGWRTRDLGAQRFAAAGIGLDRAVGAWLFALAPRWPDATQSPRAAAPQP